MTINYYLDNRSSQSEKNIILYLRGLGKTLKFNSGEKINPQHWNQKKQIVKRTYTGHPELNSYLNILKEKIKRTVRLLYVEYDLVTFDMIKDQVTNILNIKKPVDSNKAFYRAFDQFMQVIKPNPLFSSGRWLWNVILFLNVKLFVYSSLNWNMIT